MKEFLLILLFISSLGFGQEMNDKKNDTLNQPIGKLGKYELVYDCHDCHQMYSGGISVYYKKGTAKHLLFSQEIADFYVSEVSLVKIKNDYFIYVNSTHTYGHSQGYLFYLNHKTMKTYVVKIKPGKSKTLPDGEIHKYFALTKDENNHFGFGATYRTDTEDDYESREYELVKLGGNQFILKTKK